MNLLNIVADSLNSNRISRWGGAVARNILNRCYGGYILAFHSVSTKRYEEQIESLRPDKPVSLSELLDRQSNGLSTSGLFAITFDDGYREEVMGISRVCIELNYPVTFYLPTDYINGKPMPALIFENIISKIPSITLPLHGKVYDLTMSESRNKFFGNIETRMKSEKEATYFPVIDEIIEFTVENNILTEEDIFDIPAHMNWENVAELSKYENLSFESHGVSHQAVISMSEEELELELVKSKEEISGYSNREVNHFSYPYGGNLSIGEVAPRIVSRHYKSAVTMNRGRLNKKNAYTLPRIPLYEKDNTGLTTIKILTR